MRMAKSDGRSASISQAHTISRTPKLFVGRDGLGNPAKSIQNSQFEEENEVKRLGMVLALLLVATLLVSCAGGQATPAPQQATSTPQQAEPTTQPEAPTPQPAAKERVIAYVPQSGIVNETAAAYYEGIVNYATQSGFKVVTDDPQFNAGKQVQVLENFIAQKVDGIIIEPIDSALVITAIKKANDAGIPVAGFVNEIVDGQTLITVMSDAVDEGRLAGEKIVKELEEKYGEPKGLVLEVTGPLASELVQKRSKGFTDVMDKHPNITVLQRPCDWEIPKAENTVMDVLTANPELDAIYTHSDFYGDAVESALVSKGRLAKVGEEGHIIWTSIDGSPPALNRVKNGIQDSTSNAACDEFGISAMFIANHVTKGETPKAGDEFTLEGKYWSPAKLREGLSGPVLVIPSLLIDSGNVDDPSLWGNKEYDVG